ncbi:MAG: YfiR family protein, partial [Opitutae bacterium]|nr:YfiR family protein [Opitutae bacterium]
EYEVKAAFLFNFAQFVEWPAAAFPEPQTPLIIGVLGEDPFGADLDDTVRGEKIGSHPLVVRRYRRPEEIDRCHILFVSHSETGRLEQVVAGLRGRHILTVSDAAGYAVRGIMIRFVTEKSRIRLRINLDAAKADGLVLSSKLLRPADIVTTGG